MALPKDYDAALWIDPLMFQGLVGTALARSGQKGGGYSDLFRGDGFAKPEADLRKMKWAAEAIDEERERRRQWKEARGT